MNPGVVFLIWWAACCAAVALIILTATNFDRIAVAFLCLVDAPVYEEAGTASARLVFTILSAVAEAERDRIRERVAQVKQDQKDRGRYRGGKVPFGYRVGGDGALVSDDAQRAAIQVAYRMRAEGATMRTILAAEEWSSPIVGGGSPRAA